MLVWNPYGAFGALALVAGWGFAALVYFAAPHRTQNRFLALLLFAEGLSIGVGEGVMYLMRDARDGYAAQQVCLWAGIAVPFLYLLLLSTLDAPIVRPLRARGVRIALALAAALAPFAVVLWPKHFLVAVRPHPAYTWGAIGGPGFGPIFDAWAWVSAFGLLCALWAYARAPRGTGAREQGKWFVIAFGVRDAILIFIQLNNAFQLTAGLTLPFRLGILWPLVTILFVGLAGYGIARTQLFDIDLRLKRGLSRGTLVGFFAAVFVAVAEVAQTFLSEAFGYLAGAVAAALLLLALRPLDGLAQRVANAAMPGVRDTPEYAHGRKLAIVRAALEGAYADGEMTAKEREMVRRLQLELGIANDEVERLEAELRNAHKPAAG